MADLPFLDKLDKNQLEIADKIITKAQEIGVDPRFALTLAYTESNLRPAATSEKGAIGVMQVMPATGKLLGVEEKKLRDVDTNIDAGLRYLKQGIDRYQDPQLAAVGYNAGMDHPFLLGKSDKLPEESLGYVNKINAYGGFDAPVAAPTEGAPAPKADVTPASESDYRSTKAAALGAGLGASAGAVKTLFPGARGAQASAIAAGAPSATTGANTPGAKWASKVVGRVAPGADSVAEQAQSWNRVKGQGPVTSRLSGRFGVTEPGQIGKLSVQSVEAPGMMQKAASGLEDAGKFLTKHRIAGGALAGAGAGFGAQEAMDRYNRGDMLGAGVAGVGALGSLASMIPHPITRAVGTGLGMASPLALSVLDRLHNQPAQQPQP